MREFERGNSAPRGTSRLARTGAIRWIFLKENELLYSLSLSPRITVDIVANFRSRPQRDVRSAAIDGCNLIADSTRRCNGLVKLLGWCLEA